MARGVVRTPLKNLLEPRVYITYKNSRFFSQGERKGDQGDQSEITMRSYIVSLTYNPGHIISAHGDVTSSLMVAIKTAEISFSFSSLALYQA